MSYGIDILPKERDALDAIFNLALLCDQENYQQSGNYGDEWPDTARAKARTWRGAAKLAKRLGWENTARRCHTLARNLEASAKEYRQFYGTSKCPHCGHKSHDGVSCLESDCCGCGQ